MQHLLIIYYEPDTTYWEYSKEENRAFLQFWNLYYSEEKQTIKTTHCNVK